MFFPIATGAHATTDCNSCHGGFASFKEFACTSCHDHAQAVTDPGHAGVSGYLYDSKACLSCHPQGSASAISRTDHAKFFPIDVGTAHAAAQCSDCHTSATDRTQFTCISCHDHADAVTTPNHAAVTGYQYASAACYRCHADGRAVFDHSMLPVPPNCIGCHQAALAMAVTTPASMHVANRFPTTCESCHTSFTAWGPGTAMQHQAVGGTAAKCETCHLADFNAATTPFNHAAQKVAASACNTCHTDFTSWTKFVHNPSNCYNGTTLRGHQGATCVQCHTVAGDYSQSSCTACHSNRGTNCSGG